MTSQKAMIFLDLNASLRDGAVHLDLHIKPIDSQQDLHYQSPHLQCIKVSIPYGQLLRANRIYLSKKEFKRNICWVKGEFLAKGYLEKIINDQLDKVVVGKTPSIKKSSEIGTHFEVTYYPKIKDLTKLIKDLLPFTLNSEEEVKKLF